MRGGRGLKGLQVERQQRAERERGRCERNMGDDSRKMDYCQGIVPLYLSFE